MFPEQKIAKDKKDKTWKLNCLRHFTQTFGNNNIYNNNTLRLFEIASGKKNHSSYNYIENPFHLKGDKYKKYPEKIKRFDILSPMFLRILSDYLKRPFEPIVFTKNSNFDNERQQVEKELINQTLQAKFINQLVEKGLIEPEQQVDELSPDIIKSQVTSLKDDVTIEGQNIIDYVIDRQNIEHKYLKEFYNFIVTNRVVTFKDVRNDEVVKYTINPANFEYVNSEGLEYFEDSNVVKATWRLTYEDVVAIFQDELEEEYPGALNDLQHNQNYGHGFFNTWSKNQGLSEGQIEITNNHIIVEHVQWTSYRLVYNLGTLEDGSFIIVDEDYIGDYISKRWQEEIREGYNIGGKYLIGGDVVDFPVYDEIDPFRCKKNYTGINFMNDMIQQIPLPEKLIPYQEAYDVIKWKIQYTINKNKDKLAIIPIGLLKSAFQADVYNGDDDLKPNGESDGLDEYGNNPIAKALHFADISGFLPVDESSDNAQIAAQMIKQIDLSLGNYIEFLIGYLDRIKNECEDVIGFNRFITGDYDKRDPVRNVQAGLKQSSAIIELYLAYFQKYKQNDLQGILNLAKFAYKSGKALTFIRDNSSIVRFDVSDKFALQTQGIFIKDSIKTSEVLDVLKQQSTTMLQNGMKQSTWAKLISQSNNYASIIQEIENAEVEIQQQTEQQAEADRQNRIQLQNMMNADKQADRKLEKYKIDTNAQIAIDKTIATLQSFNADNPEAIANLEKVRAGQLKDLFESQKSVNEIISAEKIAKMKADTDKYKADTQLKVAKENKG
jgi:hypothetical protein